MRGASSDPCGEAFHGEEPLSEKEVQSVARFLEIQKKRLVGYLDIHSYGQMLLFPWGYTQEQSKDHIEMVRNIKTVADPGEGSEPLGPPCEPPSPPYLKLWIRQLKYIEFEQNAVTDENRSFPSSSLSTTEGNLLCLTLTSLNLV